MRTLLERTSGPARTYGSPPGSNPQPPQALTRERAAASDVEMAVRIVDRTLHFGSLLLHAGIYLVLAVIADRVDFGPHLLAGVLFGDFAGYVGCALWQFRRAPVATVAEFLFFAGLFAAWWLRYAWPELPEFRALFYLGGMAALTARITAAISPD